MTREQVQYVRLDPITQGVQLPVLPMAVFDGVKNAEAKRAAIRALALSDDTAEKKRLLEESEAETALLRGVGDALVATFFAAAKEGERKKALKALSEKLALQSHGVQGLRATVDAAREGLTLRPFHWELEFPEVFARGNPGFDAVVGNPPFAGKNANFSTVGETYVYYLLDTTPQSLGSADLSAFFFRRAFDLLREGGAFGLIATNTIAQGDSRLTSLRWICENGGDIYCARRRVPWPGQAAVMVSIVHAARGYAAIQHTIDGIDCSSISAFLVAGKNNNNPTSLESNRHIAFQGHNVLGYGFMFGAEPGMNSPEEMANIFANFAHDASRIRPFIGGEEVNSDPEHRHRRHVIDLSDYTEDEAASFTELYRILKARVWPERQKLGTNADARKRKAQWWRWGQIAFSLNAAIRNMDFVFCLSQTSKYLCVARLRSSLVFSNKLVVFATSSFSFFSLVQSRAHESWAQFFGSTLEDRPVYTPTDCFETFPFPRGWEANAVLDAAGRAYHDLRAQLMVANDQGLTKTYNRFHDPEEDSPGILELRRLHDVMDRAVLDAYGWPDLQPTCEFLLEYEAAEGDDGGGRKRKPWRYRWPAATRDEVLARLLALNGERAAEERLKLDARALAISAERPSVVQGKAKQAPKPGKARAAGATAVLKGIK